MIFVVYHLSLIVFYFCCYQVLNETSCQCSCQSCLAGEYQCSNGQCIPDSRRCDGVIDCIDDEVGCGMYFYLLFISLLSWYFSLLTVFLSSLCISQRELCISLSVSLYALYFSLLSVFLRENSVSLSLCFSLCSVFLSSLCISQR